VTLSTCSGRTIKTRRGRPRRLYPSQIVVEAAKAPLDEPDMKELYALLLNLLCRLASKQHATTAQRHLLANATKFQDDTAHSRASIHTMHEYPPRADTVCSSELHLPGQHEALIAQQQLGAVRAIPEETRAIQPPRKEGRIYLLAGGLLACSVCGASLTPAPTYRSGLPAYAYYRCARHGRVEKKCAIGSIPASSLEQAVLEVVGSLALRPEALDTILMRAGQVDPRRAQLQQSQERIKTEIRKIDAEFQRALDRLTCEDWKNPDEMEGLIVEQTRRLGARRDKASRELVQSNAALQAIQMADAGVEAVRQAVTNLKTLFAEASEVEQARLLRLLLERIDLDQDGTARLLVRAPLDGGVLACGPGSRGG